MSYLVGRCMYVCMDVHSISILATILWRDVDPKIHDILHILQPVTKDIDHSFSRRYLRHSFLPIERIIRSTLVLVCTVLTCTMYGTDDSGPFLQDTAQVQKVNRSNQRIGKRKG